MIWMLLTSSLLLTSAGMSLLRCFKVSSDTTRLPDPRGPLSTTVPSSYIESANAEVKRVIETEESSIDEKEATN